MGEYLFIASAIFSIVNGTVLLWLNPRRRTNQVFFGSAVWIALWFMCIVFAVRAGQRLPTSGESVIFWIRVSSVVGAFSISLSWLMKACLLKNHEALAPTLRAFLPWLSISVALAALATSDSFVIATSSSTNKERGLAYFAYSTVMMFCFALLFADAIRNISQLRGIRKIEMQFFVVGGILACSLAIVSHGIGLFLDLQLLRHSSSAWFSALHGVTVWAVCYHRVFDAKQVIFSIGQRLLLLTAIGLNALALHHLFSQFFSASWSLLFAMIAAGAAGIAIDLPSRRWAGLDSEHLSAAPRRQIIEWAREVPEEHKLKEHFEQLLRDMCGTNSAQILTSRDINNLGQGATAQNEWPVFAVLCKDGWSTPETLQRSRPTPGTRECSAFLSKHKLGALLAAPKGCRPPSLVIALGLKESLRPYTFPDIQVLLEIAQLMDNILTHSRVATQAAHVERMASVTMISRGLAHDLNSLATPVSAFLVHMEGKVAPGTLEATVLHEAKSSLQVMQNYIQESLFFSGSLVPHFTLIRPRALLDDAVNLSLDRARNINALVVARQVVDCTFVGDLALLQRLLQNLVFNAIDASQEGGIVEVSATVSDNHQVRLQVTDTGTGIPTEIRSRIFEPYYTTKNSRNERRGLGLGLAICQKVVEIHGGSIDVCPNLPRGTIVSATFPTMNTPTALSSASKEHPVSVNLRPHEPVSTFGSLSQSMEPKP